MADESEGRRRLETPLRAQSRRSRSRSRSRISRRTRSRSRSHLRRLVERDLALERERERVRRLERDLRREREEATVREGRLHRDDSNQSHRASVGEPSAAPRRQRAPSSNDGGRRKRSCSPVFSTNDILKIVKAIKGNPPDQSHTQATKHLDYKNILPDFDPSSKNQRMDMWLKKVNECASVYGWDERTTVHFAMQKLQGLAKIWYESLNSILFSWEEWQVKLMGAFPCEQNYGQSLEDMLRRKSRFNEPIENYFYEKLSLLNQCEIVGKRSVDCIIHGISDRTMRSSALALRCTEPDELLRFLSSYNKDSNAFPSKEKSSVSGYDRNKANHKTTHNPTVFCYNCKEKGHPYMKCTKPLIKCSRCNRIGHNTESCVLRQDQSQITNKGNTVKNTLRISHSNLNDKFVKEVSVNGVTLQGFVDFGSEVTLIRHSEIAKLGVVHDSVPSVMKGFGNSLVQSIGSATLDLIIDGVAANVQCRVVEDQLLEKPLLIGQTFSEQPHVVVYKDAHALRFIESGSELSNICLHEEESRLERVRLTGHTMLFGIANVIAQLESRFTGNVLIETRIVGKPNQQFVVKGGLYDTKDGIVHVLVIPCNVPSLLQEGYVFCRAEKVELVNRLIMPTDSSCGEIEKLNTSEVTGFNESLIRIGNVSEDDRIKLLELLKRYERCFANDLAGLGCTTVTEMKIELNSKSPVAYRPYRLSHHEREKVRGMIDEMLQADIIKESVSDYASPIILVRKKDGNLRMCIDYRKLNSLTVKERYPMPIIEDEIARLSGQACFITLDLMSGYYQVPIAAESKHVTAFVTPDGQYEFNRMPFGLANAPAVFQRMMNHVLGQARFDRATVYIDDLLIYGRTPGECLVRLEDILQILERANLKLNLSKCSFLQDKIDYLGYEISAAGMRPGEKKIECVVSFPCPQNVHGVRQFLGLVSYFRKFIRSFSELASPLTKLLKKDVVWEWGPDQENAFSSLKSALIQRPVLTIYDPAAETELHTDASRLGIGAILLQRSQGSSDPFKPVAYYSRQTTAEERNFHSYELETLAVVCALKKFRVFLLGKVFKIITDCSALRSTFVKRDLIPRIARWWLALQEFDCSVEYRAGLKMAHVDALSRNPIEELEQTSTSEQHPDILTITDEDWLLTLQLGDSELARIRDTIESGLDAKGLDHIKQNYVIKDNRLYRCLGGDNTKLRWVVPKGARWQVCKMNHDDIGHLGSEKTLERIKKHYWFAKLKRFVKKYVAACIECAYAKKKENNRDGLLHPIPKVAIPFHTMHIDHLGPFVKSNRGNTHILVAVDSFTKFVFVKSVRNTNTQNVVKVLEDIFYTFRTPVRIVSDRGSCFTSHAFKKFCCDAGVTHVLNAVASPRSNGQVERYNRTILNSLTAQNLRDNEKDWDKKLGKIQWGLNNSVQKSIGKTPAEVLFGMSMNGELKPTLNDITEGTCEGTDLNYLRLEVKNNIDRAQEIQKRNYDKGRKPARIYDVGDLVKILKTAFQNEGKSTKLMPTYEGPYRVVKVIGKDRYKVAPIAGFEGMRNKRKTTVAADRMHPWIHLASLELCDGSDNEEKSCDGDVSE